MDLMESSVGRGPVPMDFTYYLPVNIVFGFGKADRVGELTRPWGNKALIVTGRSSAKKSGLYDRVNNSLKAAGLETALFDKVAQNPLTTTAEEGAAYAREQGCDVVVAVGGGSIIDCAKGLAFMAENDGDINDYIFNRRRSDKALQAQTGSRCEAVLAKFRRSMRYMHFCPSDVLCAPLFKLWQFVWRAINHYL